MEKEIVDPTRIIGDPTKEFFIFMLTKDIDLTRAIADLVDNSIDGARQLKGDKSYKGLRVDVVANDRSFTIQDNCGGMSIAVAREYAFRFGRPKDAPKLPHSIGQFGVGMKRALFKIGKKFRVVSHHKNERFVVEESIDTWASKQPWDFHFKELEENYQGKAERGTAIEVSVLHPAIADEFRLDLFLGRLRSELIAAHMHSISKGLKITLNGAELEYKPIKLLTSGDLAPGFERHKINIEGKTIDVKIHVGIGDSDPKSAGWYIFCNGRLIAEAEKTYKTGWGDGINNFHNEYARFKGYVSFDADDASRLPWNTTKSDVDQDSPVYRQIRVRMMSMMKPVITFLAAVAKEKKTLAEDDVSPLEEKLKKADKVGLEKIAKAAAFKSPAPIAKKKPAGAVSIQYSRSALAVKQVKKSLAVASNREVGEKTFQYYFDKEC